MPARRAMGCCSPTGWLPIRAPNRHPGTHSDCQQASARRSIARCASRRQRFRWKSPSIPSIICVTLRTGVHQRRFRPAVRMPARCGKPSVLSLSGKPAAMPILPTPSGPRLGLWDRPVAPTPGHCSFRVIAWFRYPPRVEGPAGMPGNGWGRLRTSRVGYWVMRCQGPGPVSRRPVGCRKVILVLLFSRDVRSL